MNLEQAERLKANEDFKAFLGLLEEDISAIKEDLVNAADVNSVLTTQIKIKTIRMVGRRLDSVIEDFKPEEPTASDQSTA